MNKDLTKLLCATFAAFIFSNGYSQTPLPQIQQYGTTQYISGGIGIDECNVIKTEACNWPLQLMFSEVQAGSTVGAWVSDVDVKITDKSGNSVLSIITQGPLLLVKIPSGLYTLTANYQGKIATRNISVREGRNETVSVHWASK
jgi:hypothetical protein